MSKKDIKGKIKITTFNELLNVGSEYNGDFTEVSLEELHPFEKHPFHVVDDERMEELVESIKKKGVLSPAIVRKKQPEGYEIISGHRRKRACELAGLKKMPVIIKDLDDDEATILMVDANIQRENILPSERAFSLQMKMNALKNQGKRTDLTSGQLVQKSTSDDIGEEDGISGRQVRRYVSLTNLLPELLDMVDSEKIGFIPAVNLSGIDKTEQKWILKTINETNKKITLKESKLLKDEFSNKTLTEETVVNILVGDKKKIRTVNFTEKELAEYFSEEVDSKHIKKIILELLTEWKEETENG